MESEKSTDDVCAFYLFSFPLQDIQHQCTYKFKKYMYYVAISVVIQLYHFTCNSQNFSNGF